MTGTIILLLAILFTIAGISKLRSRPAFSAVLRNLIPASLVKPATIVIPAIELLLAGFLFSGIAPQKALAAAIALLAVFTVILAEMWRRGLKGCACFGETGTAATNGSGVIRNLLLIGAAAAVINQPGPVSLFGPDVSSFLARMTVVAGAFCFWSCLAALAGRRKSIFSQLKT
jgi:hypothetical protein